MSLVTFQFDQDRSSSVSNQGGYFQSLLSVLHWTTPTAFVGRCASWNDRVHLQPVGSTIEHLSNLNYPKVLNLQSKISIANSNQPTSNIPSFTNHRGQETSNLYRCLQWSHEFELCRRPRTNINKNGSKTQHGCC